jgi:hypothetical protein
VDFFKKKLLEAEQYITNLEEERVTEQQNVIISVNEGQKENNEKNPMELINRILV